MNNRLGYWLMYRGQHVCLNPTKTKKRKKEVFGRKYESRPQKVAEISADFCISRPKLTIQKSALPDSKKVIKKRPLIDEPNMNSSRLPEGLEFIQKHVIKRQKRTNNMPKSSQKDAKRSQGLPKWSPGAHKNDTKMRQVVQKLITSVKSNFLMIC